MHSLEIINALNAEGAEPKPTGATVRVDTTHRKTEAPDPSQCEDGSEWLPALKPDRPQGPQASPAWLHRMYFGTGANAGLTVDKGHDMHEVTQSFIVAYADQIFDKGYTFYVVEGRFHTERERSYVLEVVTGHRHGFKDEIVSLGRAYRARFDQDAVMVTHNVVNVELI